MNLDITIIETFNRALVDYLVQDLILILTFIIIVGNGFGRV